MFTLTKRTFLQIFQVVALLSCLSCNKPTDAGSGGGATPPSPPSPPSPPAPQPISVNAVVGWWKTTQWTYTQSPGFYDYDIRYFGADSFYYQRGGKVGPATANTGIWWLTKDTLNIKILQGQFVGSSVKFNIAQIASRSLQLKTQLFTLSPYTRLDSAGFSSQPITTVAGSGENTGFFLIPGDGGQALKAQMKPIALAVDVAGNIYIAEEGHYIRKITIATGIITRVAGTGNESFTAVDGNALSVNISPSAMAFDSKGNLIFSDYKSHRIRKLTPGGQIITIAGNGSPFDGGFAGDGGPAISAALYYPGTLRIDAADNIYFKDSLCRLRKINATDGKINTIAGTGVRAFSGDGGPANAAAIMEGGIDIDAAGNIYLSGGNRIRKISAATGIITTIAGTGVAGYNGDQVPALQALITPGSLTVTPNGDIYFTGEKHHIRKLTASTGLISNVAGIYGFGNTNYPAWGLGCKYATAFQLYYPGEHAIDHQGNILFIDSYNYCIRKLFR